MSQLPPMDLFGAWLFLVADQQLSVAATRRTWRASGPVSRTSPGTAELLVVEPDQPCEAELSWRKVGALRDLAERISYGRLYLDVLSGLPDEELMAELTAIRGIGP